MVSYNNFGRVTSKGLTAPMRQLRLGPIWLTLFGYELTIWFGRYRGILIKLLGR